MTPTFALIAKEPASGRAKTRLAATLGAEAAQRLALAMLLDSADALVRAAPPDARLVLYHDPPDAGPRLRRVGLPDRLALIPQRGGGLGERLERLCQDELAADASACVIAATDSPFALDPDIVDCLPRDRDEVVLAPCEDGGYWAVGVARPAPVFDVAMSTPDVLSATTARARAAARPVRLLAPAPDLDVERDLADTARRGLLLRAPRTARLWADLSWKGRRGRGPGRGRPLDGCGVNPFRDVLGLGAKSGADSGRA